MMTKTCCRNNLVIVRVGGHAIVKSTYQAHVNAVEMMLLELEPSLTRFCYRHQYLVVAAAAAAAVAVTVMTVLAFAVAAGVNVVGVARSCRRPVKA